MSLPNEVIPLLAGAQKEYEIARSLRFNSADSAYLSRTFGTATSATIYTLSLWVKRGLITGTYRLFGASTTTFLTFNSSDQINITLNGTSAATTTAVYRDPSAWYHIVYQQNGNAQTIYVNNVSVATGTTAAAVFNTAIAHQIGAANTTNYYNGYMAEVNFIDGQALTPSSFGETSSTTGVWIPKRYTGTYGTNGFYLSFANNASTTTLGYDDAGGIAGSGAGSNDWTLNNFSVTAGVGNDSLTDSPTNNFPTLSPIDKNASSVLSNGNLNFTLNSTAATFGVKSTFSIPRSGKWYWEVTNVIANPYLVLLGLAKAVQLGSSTTLGTGTTMGISWSEFASYDQSYVTDWAAIPVNSWAGMSSPKAANDVVMIAIDSDNGKLWFGKNGTWWNTSGTANPATGTDPRFSSIDMTQEWMPYAQAYFTTYPDLAFNFGQRPFAYTAPSGFKALSSQNIPTPTILNGSKYMNAVTWTGTGATRSITGVGFQPDLIWSKSRSNAETHKLVDSTRGATKALSSETTGDEVTESGITSFDADGFTIDGATDTGYNTNTYTYVGWLWKKGVTPGFDIVTYTGNGSARTISHSLGAVPHFMIVKARTTAGTDQGWAVYHRNNTTAPETDYLLLNSTAATADLDTIWNDTAPTSSVFSVGTNALVNTNNDTYLAYLWTEIPGFSRFGSYTGNGSTDGPFVWCGFRPKFVVIKRTDSTGDWWVYDTVRNTINASVNKILFNSNALEDTAGEDIDIISNGFKVRTTAAGLNTSTATYIFAAFAETSFKYSRSR
jgi:hypothetical protein